MVLDDIPYSTLQKNRQGYEILLLRDHHNRSFAAIGRELGICTARVCGQYNKIKVRQVRLYIRHIAVALGHENTAQVRKEFFTALECYQNYACACGYLENTYPEILEAYRGGGAGDIPNGVGGFAPLSGVTGGGGDSPHCDHAGGGKGHLSGHWQGVPHHTGKGPTHL